MGKKEYLIINASILPDSYLKVIKMKKLLKDDHTMSISTAARRIGLSRGTFYRYKDKVFSLEESSIVKRLILELIIDVRYSPLPTLFKVIEEEKFNVISVDHSFPVNHISKIVIALNVKNYGDSLNKLINELGNILGVSRVKILPQLSNQVQH